MPLHFFLDAIQPPEFCIPRTNLGAVMLAAMKLPRLKTILLAPIYLFAAFYLLLAIANIIESLVSVVRDPIVAAIDGTTNVLETGITEVGNTVRSIVDAAENVIVNAIEGGTEIVNNGIDALEKTVTTAIQSTEGVLSQAIQSTGEVLKASIEGVVDVLLAPLNFLIASAAFTVTKSLVKSLFFIPKSKYFISISK